MKVAYEAFDRTGNAVRDVIEASDAAEASDVLRRRGLYVTHVGKTFKDGAAAGQDRREKRVRRRGKDLKNVALFARQLYVLVSSGTRVVEAMEALQKQTKDPKWSAVITDIRTHVEQGSSLSEAVKHHPEYFDAVSRNLINAGESTGKLPAMLSRLATLTQKQLQIRRAIVGAMVYPSLLVVVSVSVLVLMLLFVLPRFIVLFDMLDVPLPPTTRVLVMLSNLLQSWWWLLLIAVVGGAVGVRFWLQSHHGKKTLDNFALKLPYLSEVTRNFATARIARLLGILLDSHMPLIEVLKLIRQTSSNHRYAELMAHAEDAVMRGEPISAAFAQSDLINPSVCQVIRSGEQSGQLGTLLLNISDLMDEENEVVVRSIASILEPIILIGLGVLVGFVTMSMFMPLFDLTAGPPGAS